MLTKHQIVHDLVARLTSNPSFRTFFILYLMAEKDVERMQIEQFFWKEIDQLSDEDRQLINAEFTRTFLQIPILLEQIQQKIQGRRMAA